MQTFKQLFAALTLSLLCSAPASAETIIGRVINIADGDTLILVDTQQQQHKISLAGIDAPELNQAFGQQALSSLSAIALNQPATAHCKPLERFPHLICTLSIGGRDIGLTQIQSGMAWWYRQNAAALSVQTQSDYRQAEFDAKIHRRGLWNNQNPTPPWDWRHGRIDD